MSYVASETLKRACKSAAACAVALGLALGWAGGAAAQTLRVGTLPIITQLPFFTAVEKGYFKEAGLDVQVRNFPGGAALLEAMNVNAVDIAAAVNLSTFLAAKQQGFDHVIIAGDSGIGTRYPDVAMVMVRRDSGINSVKDLAGKRIGQPNLRSLNQAYMMEYLSRNGVDPNSVTWVEIGIPRGPAALITKQVDAADLVEPFVAVANESGEVKALFSEFTEIDPGGLISIQAARREWAGPNADILRRYVAVLKRALDDVQANQQEARARLTRHTKIDQNLANKVTWPSWKLYVEPKDLRIPMEMSVKYGLLAKPLPIEPMIFQSALPR